MTMKKHRTIYTTAARYDALLANLKRIGYIRNHVSPATGHTYLAIGGMGWVKAGRFPTLIIAVSQ
jgi:hypothetical protein